MLLNDVVCIAGAKIGRKYAAGYVYSQNQAKGVVDKRATTQVIHMWGMWGMWGVAAHVTVFCDGIMVLMVYEKVLGSAAIVGANRELVLHQPRDGALGLHVSMPSAATCIQLCA